MRRRRHDLPHINTSSMTDLAFTLLFFFLVAATIDADSGLLRLLPPQENAQQKADPPKVKERNVLVIELHPKNVIVVGNSQTNLRDLEQRCVDFIDNKNNDELLSESSIQNINLVGKVAVSKGIIYLKIHRQASYQSYISLQGAVTAAYNRLRNAASVRYFQKRQDLLSEQQHDALKKMIPQRVTETEL